MPEPLEDDDSSLTINEPSLSNRETALYGPLTTDILSLTPESICMYSSS